MPVVDINKEAVSAEPSSANKSQSNAAMLLHSSPKPQEPVPGGYQPQSPVVNQPQPVSPMHIQKQVYRDFGANDPGRPLGEDRKRQWSYGLFDCFGRCGLCCCAVWCPCVVFGKTRQRVHSLQDQGRILEGGGSTYSTRCCLYAVAFSLGHPCIMHIQPRMEMRERYSIRGNILYDGLAVAFCNPCALTQERREVEMEETRYRQRVGESEK